MFCSDTTTHILTLASTWGLPFTACLSTWTRPLPEPSNGLVQATFEPNLFPYKYPNNLIPVIIPTYNTCEDGTVFRNVDM